jgi:hypothetical protein
MSTPRSFSRPFLWPDRPIEFVYCVSVIVLSSRTSAGLAVKHCRSIFTSPALVSQRSEVPSVGVSASLVTNTGCSVPRDPSGDRGGSQNLAENFAGPTADLESLFPEK